MRSRHHVLRLAEPADVVRNVRESVGRGVHLLSHGNHPPAGSTSRPRACPNRVSAALHRRIRRGSLRLEELLDHVWTARTYRHASIETSGTPDAQVTVITMLTLLFRSSTDALIPGPGSSLLTLNPSVVVQDCR